MAVLFPATVDSAFAVKSTITGLTMASSFIMATVFCPLTRIHSALGLLVTGLLGYVSVEFIHHRELQMFKRDDHEYLLLGSGDQQDDGELRVRVQDMLEEEKPVEEEEYEETEIS